jgi:hypothetical protein
LADIDAGMGEYYDFTWSTPFVTLGNNGYLNVCSDAGIMTGTPDGGEYFVTPLSPWITGAGITPVCKVCAFLTEKDVNPPASPSGNCGFDGGYSPAVVHCWLCQMGGTCQVLP